MMQTFFPSRCRQDLKNKFKREEKINRSLIDAAISRPSAFNITNLKEELGELKKFNYTRYNREIDTYLQTSLKNHYLI